MLVSTTQVELGFFNTTYIERLNATFCTWLPAATCHSWTLAARRIKLEAALFWMGMVYNFCHIHVLLLILEPIPQKLVNRLDSVNKTRGHDRVACNATLCCSVTLWSNIIDFCHL